MDQSTVAEQWLHALGVDYQPINRRIHEHWVKRWRELGGPPRIDEEAAALGLPRSTTMGALLRLVDMGAMAKLERGVYLPNAEWEW